MYKIEDRKIIFPRYLKFDIFPFLGLGSHGNVYKIKIRNTEYALKIFNGIWEERIENYERKLDVNLTSYITPIKLAYLDDIFVGYLMNLCKSKNLYDKRLNISINTFKDECNILKQDTIKIGQLGYTIDDTYSTNVCYDNGFRMIDTDSYNYNEKLSIESINQENINQIEELLYNVLILSTDLEHLFYKNQDLKRIKQQWILKNISFEEMFDKLVYLANDINDKPISRVSTIGSVLKKRLIK